MTQQTDLQDSQHTDTRGCVRVSGCVWVGAWGGCYEFCLNFLDFFLFIYYLKKSVCAYSFGLISLSLLFFFVLFILLLLYRCILLRDR